MFNFCNIFYGFKGYSQLHDMTIRHFYIQQNIPKTAWYWRCVSVFKIDDIKISPDYFQTIVSFSKCFIYNSRASNVNHLIGVPAFCSILFGFFGSLLSFFDARISF